MSFYFDPITVVAMGIGVVALTLIRWSKIRRRYRDASETEGSAIDRLGAHYFRKRDTLELITLAAAPVLFLLILYIWGAWHS